MIYLDHAATTPVHPAVAEAMRPYLEDKFGNPSSLHRVGRIVRQAIDEAREVIASCLHADSSELIFTSGGTEADNLAVFGTAWAARERGMGNHVVTSSIEHHAVLDTCEFLEKMGFRVTYLPVNRHGEVDLDALEAALTDQTVLVSVMLGNNEVGTRQPIETIGSLVRERGAFFSYRRGTSHGPGVARLPDAAGRSDHHFRPQDQWTEGCGSPLCLPACSHRAPASWRIARAAAAGRHGKCGWDCRV